MFGWKITAEVDPTIAAEAFASGLEAKLVANGGVNGGNLGKTLQVVLKTTNENKIQLTSLDDGNVVEFYLSGDDYSNGVLKNRVFLAKGEVYIEDGIQNGSIVISSKGIMGCSGNLNNAATEESPMPLGVEGYAAKLFFMFMYRSAGSGGEGQVYVNAGAVASEVTLYTGDGQTVVDTASLDAYGWANLDTSGNGEYKLVATQPIFAGVMTNMDVPQFQDSRLLPPLSSSIIGQNQNGRLSALYDNTETWWYRQNGELGKVTNSPGNPISIYTGTFNELGDVFYIESDAVPATAGTFDIDFDLSGIQYYDQAPSTTFTTNESAYDNNDSLTCCILTTPASAPTTNRECIFELGGSTTGISILLNTSNEIEIYSNSGLAEGSPRVATSALSTSTQYVVILEIITSTLTGNLHIFTGSDFSGWAVGRTPEYTYILPGTDVVGTDGGGYGTSNGTIGGISSSPTLDDFTGTLDSNLIVQKNNFGAILEDSTVAVNIAFNANSLGVATAMTDAGFATSDFKVDFQLGTNLGDISSRVYMFMMGIFGRTLLTPTLDTSGLTGDPHVLTVYQDGSTANNMGTGADYRKEGILNLQSSGDISCLSGADNSGQEATYYVPIAALCQRMGLPVGFVDGGRALSQCGVQIQSPYKGNFKLFNSEGYLLLSDSFDRDSSLSQPSCEFEQRFPCGVGIGNAGENGVDIALTGDFLGGYIETDVPANIILNSRNNQDLIDGGITTLGDEMVCFGITPEDCRAEIRCSADRRFRKRVIENTGAENWELV